MNISSLVIGQMQNTLGEHYTAIQSRYGDPRVYASQEEQMRRDQAAVMHARSKKTETLLEDAYTRQKERNRASHGDRFKRRSESGRPRSSAERVQRQTGEPQPAGS